MLVLKTGDSPDYQRADTNPKRKREVPNDLSSPENPADILLSASKSRTRE